MEDRRIRKFGYEDTDKKIEIELYGIVFEIKDLNSIKEIEKLDKSDKNVIETYLRKILGQTCIEKINDKRKDDGYSELSLNVELNILGCIFETYAESMTNGVLGKVNNAIKNANNQMSSYTSNFNREQRRNYNKNNRGYRSRGY